MLTPNVITGLYNINQRVLVRQLDGLGHDDTLLQLPFRGNCLNWVLGHIAQSRDAALTLLGQDTLLTPEQKALYETDSKPITSGECAMSFDDLWSTLQKQHSLLVELIESKTADELDALIPDTDRTLGSRLHFLAWHEGYHAGQTELLRQLAGTDDKVI